jgi:hypothetical protein
VLWEDALILLLREDRCRFGSDFEIVYLESRLQPLGSIAVFLAIVDENIVLK